MNANDYNKQQLDNGDLTPAHITTLTTFWQEGHSGLSVDGKCGPATRESIEEQSGPAVSAVGTESLSVAIENIGNGEEGGNNSGPFVEMLKGKTWDGNDDDDGAWCADFVGWCVQVASDRLGVPMPIVRSGGAKKLFSNIKEAGCEVTNPLPGDVVCWDRGNPGSWQGHIGFVEKYEGGILYTVEGNVGKYPAKVKRFMHDVLKDERLVGYARIP
tara:strand:+ start:5103 stop:5747 length:645 start_codon:yes stop_codon:yes gene_type:complete